MDHLGRANVDHLARADGGSVTPSCDTQLGSDKALLELLGKASWPSPDAARQFLLAFHDAEALAAATAALPPDALAVIAPENAALRGLARVMSELASRLASHQRIRVATLERDETIIESRKLDAKPHYKQGRGYQPSVVYWVETDMVVADEFRDGNVPAGMSPLSVIRRAFETLPASVEVRRFRGDSACYEESTLKWLAHADNRIERFTISADMSPQLAQACAAVPDAQWQLLEKRTNELVWWAEVEFTPGDWPKTASPLRYLVRRIEKRQSDLLAPETTRKHLAIVSNDRKTPGPALLAWHYARAGTIEKLHDVVKNELGGGVLPCAELGANAAWWRLCLITYNVLSALKKVGLPVEFDDARPKRLRFAIFNVAARIAREARRLIARVTQIVIQRIDALATRRRIWTLAVIPPPKAMS